MKLTNFTFLRAERGWLLKSLLPMLVFMTLSLGVEAQSTPAEALEAQLGVSLVDDYTAATRIKGYVSQLEAQNPTTQEEQARVAARSDFAMFVMSGIGNGGYQVKLVTEGREYLEGRDAEARQRGLTLDVDAIYNEMVGLLRS